MIKWGPTEPLASGGEYQTSICGRFRIYKSVIEGYAASYRSTPFAPWRPIDPVQGNNGNTRWHRRRKSALSVVESFAETNPKDGPMSTIEPTVRTLGVHDQHGCGGEVTYTYTGALGIRACKKCGQSSHAYWDHPVSGKRMRPDSPTYCDPAKLQDRLSQPPVQGETKMSETTNDVAVEETATKASRKRKTKTAKKAARATKKAPATKKAATKKGAKEPKKEKADRNVGPRAPKELGISTPQLRFLDAFKGSSKSSPMSINDMKDNLGIPRERAIIAADIRAIRDQGFISDNVSANGLPENARGAYYCITADGKKLLARAQKLGWEG